MPALSCLPSSRSDHSALTMRMQRSVLQRFFVNTESPEYLIASLKTMFRESVPMQNGPRDAFKSAVDVVNIVNITIVRSSMSQVTLAVRLCSTPDVCNGDMDGPTRSAAP